MTNVLSPFQETNDDIHRSPAYFARIDVPNIVLQPFKERKDD